MGGLWVGKRKRVTGFPLLFFALLRFGKLAVRSVNIVIVRVTSRLVLPLCNHARNTIDEDILQYILRLVQTRLLLAQRKGFEPLYTFLHNTISNRARSAAPPSLQVIPFYTIPFEIATVLRHVSHFSKKIILFSRPHFYSSSQAR